MVNNPQDNCLLRDKRRHERWACVLRMTYTLLSPEDSSPCEYCVVSSKDFSLVGVRICSEHEILSNSLLQLSITLPGYPYQVTVLSKALYCTRVEGSHFFETGVEFTGVLPPDFYRLMAEALAASARLDD